MAEDVQVNEFLVILHTGSIHAAKEDPEQRETYEKLLAMKRYHRRYGGVGVFH